MKQTAEPIVQKCQCKRIFGLHFGSLLRKLIVPPLSVNVGDDFELYIFQANNTYHPTLFPRNQTPFIYMNEIKMLERK